MLELVTDPQTWTAFATLTALKLVPGIDNIIFISILVDKLPPQRREFARRLGLFMAMFMRIGLLLVLAWIVGLVAPLFTLLGQAISGRDPILFQSGLFLVVVGVVLLAKGLDHHVPKGYACFAKAFSLGVEMINIRTRKLAAKPVELHSPYEPAHGA